MRAVHLHDLDTLTRALLAVDMADRAGLAQKAVEVADIAEKYRQRLGKAHPVFGTGTLTSAVQDLPKARALQCDHAYRCCLAIVLTSLG